jgi:nucleotide-binding universal stress UspA family protein
MFSNILVPLDGTPGATSALEAAAAIAAKFDASVTLLLVAASGEIALASLAEAFGAQGSVAATVQREHTLESLGAAYLESVREEAGHPEWDCVVADGEPAEVINTEARTRGSDLIVMASHARSGIMRMLMGSVAETVIRHSGGVPVLVVHVEDED